MNSTIALARRAIALLDLTELGDAATEADVRALCEKAKGRGNVPPVAAVCVWPRHVALAKSCLPATIRVATVINFPGGEGAVSAVVAEAEDALRQGADEVDLVIPYKAAAAGDVAPAAAMVRAVRAALPAKITLKAILETGVYPDDASIAAASRTAIEHGADFIKTSTGKVPQGASLEAARVMLETIRATSRPVGLKPSGGIRTLADANAYLALADSVMGPDWARPRTFRFGASGLWDALAATIEGRDTGAGSGY